MSQEKRQRMLDALDAIRQQHKDDDEVLMALCEIESELNAKKYGLVWERHEEAVDVLMRNNIPVFTECKEKAIEADEGSGHNFLLEGDNLHSLYLLEKTHRGRIDIIYIDPPYNRGKNDFVYDDMFIGPEDEFRHSKWISFMEKRLRYAHRLLSDNGVLFVSIDENEQAVAKMLLDEIFSEKNFVIMMPRITKKSGKTTESFAKNHDYVLVYTKKNPNIFVKENHSDPAFKNEDEYVSERGKYKLNQTLDYNSLSYSSSLDYPLEIEGKVYYPGGDYEAWKRRKAGDHLRADWAWRWSRSMFEFGYKNGFVVIKTKEDGSARIYTKTYLNATICKDEKDGYRIDYIQRQKAMSSIDLVQNVYSNDNAKKDLDSFNMGISFDYPKPVELIKRLVKTHFNKNAIVLDFFAGSGTTAQAVLELNAEDGGNRRFILCTNNQNQICESVTYERCKKVILSHNFESISKFPLIEHKILRGDFTSKSPILDEIEEIKQNAKSSYKILSTKILDGHLCLIGEGKKTEKCPSVELFKHKIAISDFKLASSIMGLIDEAKKAHKDDYDGFSIKIEGDHISLYGIIKSGTWKGIPANLQYYKTDYVPKNTEDMSSNLMEHIAEMVQLEHGIRLDGKKHILVLSDEDADSLEANWESHQGISALYLSKNVQFSAKQRKLFTSVDVHIIPDYYSKSEFQDVGETC